MTCIVAVKYKDQVYLGGDSLGSSGLDVMVRQDTKVFRKKDMMIGYTSSYRLGQLLRFKLEIPVHKSKISAYEYMCTDFIDAVRKCLKDNGYTTISNNNEAIGEFIVVYKSHIFHIYDDLQVGETRNDYDACGCGEKYALGSCFAYIESNAILTKKPKYIVLAALKAAQEHSGGVRKPFTILHN